MGTPRPSPPRGPGPGGQMCISESPGPGWAGESWNPRGHEGWSCWPGSAFKVESAQPSEACVSSWRHSPAAGCVGRMLADRLGAGTLQAPFQDVFRVSTSCQNPLKSSLTGAALPLPSVLLPPGFLSARSQENNFCQCKLPFFGGSRVID